MRRSTQYFLFLFFLFMLTPCFAQTTETIEISTYYPAPYGSYAELTTTSNTSLATDTGSVGIGTTNPQAKLEVGGGIKVGFDNGTCDANKEGTMRWNTTIHAMQHCNGTSWDSPSNLFWFGDAGIYLINGANSSATCTIACGGTCVVPSLIVTASSRVNAGVVQTRVTGSFNGVTSSDSCDSGWVSANMVSCNVGPINTYTGSVTAEAKTSGVLAVASRSDGASCFDVGYWN